LVAPAAQGDLDDRQGPFDEWYVVATDPELVARRNG
jgi:hypothetical protein